MTLSPSLIAGALAAPLALLQEPEGVRLHTDTPAPGDTMTVLHPPPGLSRFELAVRWFFSVPQWVQLTGVAIAAVVALVALVALWRLRHALGAWVRQRHVRTAPGWKAAGALLALGVLLVFGVFGFRFFVFTQHDNEFCVACHQLHDEVYERFQQSKHHKDGHLECHDCHKESMFASMMQVVKWVAFRPGAVGPHAPVPTPICEQCHARQDPDSNWQRIIATAGHKIHVTSDTARKLDIQCVTCHGVTAHRFAPVSQTCGQSGCHEHAQINLGRMASQTDLHCVMCHRFNVPLRETAAFDTARAALVPDYAQCLRCHQMKVKLASFEPERDPHEGRCGDCHDPHKQRTPAAAFESCTRSGCHAHPDTLTAFHRGIARSTLEDCGRCHQAHTWTVKGSACLTCHRDIYRDGGRATVAAGPRAALGWRHPPPLAALAGAGARGR